MKITGDVDELMRAVALVVTKLRCRACLRCCTMAWGMLGMLAWRGWWLAG